MLRISHGEIRAEARSLGLVQVSCRTGARAASLDRFETLQLASAQKAQAPQKNMAAAGATPGHCPLARGTSRSEPRLIPISKWQRSVHQLLGKRPRSVSLEGGVKGYAPDKVRGVRRRSAGRLGYTTPASQTRGSYHGCQPSTDRGWRRVRSRSSSRPAGQHRIGRRGVEA